MELKQLLSEQEAVNEARKIINSVLGMRWMIAVWCVEEADKKEEMNVLRLAGRTTWRFPPGDFEESLRLLRDQLTKEAAPRVPPVPAPLEMAPFLLGEQDRDEEKLDEFVEPLDGPDLSELFRVKEGDGKR